MRFAYLISEGVLDVAFLVQVLRTGFGLALIEKRTQLPERARDWLESFKWPIGDDIRRLSVPAPLFVRDAHGELLVGMRNAGGLTEIRRKMEVDSEVFLRLGWRPESVGVVLDSDSRAPRERFAEFADLLGRLDYPKPQVLDAVAQAGVLRTGIYGLPGHGKPGTLEDVLLDFAKDRFPALFESASNYVQTWRARHDATDPPHEELAKPAGFKKAQVSSMIALLKPGKPISASLEDHHWVPSAQSGQMLLDPLLDFLAKLLGADRLESE